MSYIAMNRFKIPEGAESEFEDIWKSRESRLKEMQGFREFRLLKDPEGEDHMLYSNHVIWDSKEDFEAWQNHNNSATPIKTLANANAFPQS